jgi:hypothetical protein
MPRKGRGGERQGTPGTSYGNRTDLNMPISTVPGQDYGKAAVQQAAQRAVPMSSSPEPSVAQMQSQSPAASLPKPGSLPHLEPTQRPNEPVTTGLPFGPGAGPEAMGPTFANLGQVLSTAANEGGASSLAMMLSSSAKSLGL